VDTDTISIPTAEEIPTTPQRAPDTFLRPAAVEAEAVAPVPALVPAPAVDAQDVVKRILINLKLKNKNKSGLKSLDLRPDDFYLPFLAS
jgi:hypothetical protein